MRPVCWDDVLRNAYIQCTLYSTLPTNHKYVVTSIVRQHCVIFIIRLRILLYLMIHKSYLQTSRSLLWSSFMLSCPVLYWIMFLHHYPFLSKIITAIPVAIFRREDCQTEQISLMTLNRLGSRYTSLSIHEICLRK